ncbi:MAG: helix-turn-helix transcriptional regulator [Bacteroidetes bacterium]|nr:helix-turn-helix transcriptional regulator [Bacteroidota bacterium]
MSTQGLRKIHIGRNIERIRELKGIKQETLAGALGISQQAISKMEQSEFVDDERLKQIANALGVSIDSIKNYNEEAVIFHIQNMHDNSSANYQYHFNPMDKVVELYERLLKEKDEIIKQKENEIQLYKKQQKAS